MLPRAILLDSGHVAQWGREAGATQVPLGLFSGVEDDSEAGVDVLLHQVDRRGSFLPVELIEARMIPTVVGGS